MRVYIHIDWEKIDDPTLRETFRRLLQIVNGDEYEKCIEVDLKSPEFIGRQWCFPSWITVLIKSPSD